jgi:hypothetical protein
MWKLKIVSVEFRTLSTSVCLWNETGGATEASCYEIFMKFFDEFGASHSWMNMHSLIRKRGKLFISIRNRQWNPVRLYEVSKTQINKSLHFSKFISDGLWSKHKEKFSIKLFHENEWFPFPVSRNIKLKIYKTLILLGVLYGYETWSLILAEKLKLMLMENRVRKSKFVSVLN